MHDKLVTKVNATTLNNIDTSGFVLKTKYDTDKSELENKIPDTSDLVKKTDYNTKITEIEGKIPDISDLATKTTLATVENKKPDVTDLATKRALTTVENKIPHVNELVKKTDYNTRVAEIDTTLSSLDGKIAKNESIRKKLLLLFLGNIIFDSEGGSEVYLIFQPVYRYFKTVTNTNYISPWKSKGLSAENIKSLTTSDNSLNPIINYYDYT